MFRVQQAFWVKLQTPDILRPGGEGSILAVQVLEEMQRRNYTADDLEDACKRFQMKKQYGSRIEISEFFDEEKPVFRTYQWYLEQIATGKYAHEDFDAYQVPGKAKPMWLLSPPELVSGVRCVVRRGKSMLPQQEERLLPAAPLSQDVRDTVKLIARLQQRVFELEDELHTLRKQSFAKSEELHRLQDMLRASGLLAEEPEYKQPNEYQQQEERIYV